MQQIQIDNLLQLVRTSSLLDAGERQEWLQLVDLMNEKQLVELERILKSARPAAVSPLAGINPGISLRHILNIPGSQQRAEVSPKPAAIVPPQVPQSPAMGQNARVTPQASSFAGKLKTMLREKELPGRQVAELELPAHNTALEHAAAPPPKPVAPLKKTPPAVPAPKPAEKPAVINLDAIPENAAVNIQNSVVNIGSRSPVKISAKKVVEGVAPQSGAILNRPVPKMPVAHEPQGPDKREYFKTGLQNTEMLLQAKLQKEQEQKAEEAAFQERVETLKPQLPEFKKREPAMPIETPEDIAKLTVRAWHNENHESVQEELGKLVGKMGYHAVILNLEQSPLYQAYVKTGLKVLQESIPFENLGQQSGLLSESYLSRNEFEEFTDLLRKIQGST